MSRPRITPYEHVKVVDPISTYLQSPFQPMGSPAVNVDPAKPRAQPVYIRPDPYRDEQGPDFLRRIYYSDGSARLLHTEHGKTHEVAYVLPGPPEFPHSARLFYPNVVLSYLLEGVFEQELAWLQGSSVNTSEPQSRPLATFLHSELDPYRRPSPINPSPDILKCFHGDDGTTRLYLTDRHMHEVNEVVGVAPVNPNACPDRSFFVDLYLKGISAPFLRSLDPIAQILTFLKNVK